MILTYLGDALWVLALAIMFGASRQAWAQTTPGEKLRLPIGEIGRGLGIWALPGAAFAFSLWLALQARDQEGDATVILFGVRATAASLLALLHLRWLKAALERR
ncbi:hypothetical protein [Phenylobacterium soli]|uniref:Uncharacterized protein n=1 Tax=Phenylobacterium soli TaxID=2170551 RepID=A0A328AFP4_9CAUL|nr:hypothetical protein [Phenylobacterium soli]RAK53572.1 hypothetical protein DJ017_03030 [Phenylobacterium soli]